MITRRLFALLAFALAATPPALAETTLRFAVTDVAGMENLQREWGPLQALLESRTGLKIAFFPVNNRTAAVEAMNAKRVDLVFTGPAEYVVFRARTQAVPVIAIQRLDYFSCLVTRADSGVGDVAGLKGRKVALGSIGSTSRHLGPMQLMADLGINPRNDIQVAHVSINVGVEALKRGDVAAMGMNFTDLQKLRQREPGITWSVIARGRDLPLDLILAGAHVDPAIVEKLRAAIAANPAEMMKAVLAGGGENEKFAGMAWVPSVRDEDYNYVRRMYATIGQTQFSEFIGN